MRVFLNCNLCNGGLGKLNTYNFLGIALQIALFILT
jgi:hypothetical protein